MFNTLYIRFFNFFFLKEQINKMVCNILISYKTIFLLLVCFPEPVKKKSLKPLLNKLHI